MQRPRISSDEQPAAFDERAQLGEVELSEIHHAIGGRPERLSRRGGDAGGRLTVRWPRAQDDPPHRRRHREPGDERRKCRFRPSPERVAGADVGNDELVPRRNPGRVEPCRDSRVGGGIARHLHAVARRVRSPRGPAVNRLEQVPLVHDRVARPQPPRAGHCFRVHPRPPRDRVADSFPRARCERQPRAARTAVQIDDEVVPRAPQPPCEPQVGCDPRHPARPRRDDHLIEVRVACDDRRRRRLHQIREMRIRKHPFQCPRDRRREDDVADEPKAYE